MDVKHIERALEGERELFSASRRPIEKVILAPTCLIERPPTVVLCNDHVGLVSGGGGADCVESNVGLFTLGERRRRFYR